MIGSSQVPRSAEKLRLFHQSGVSRQSGEMSWVSSTQKWLRNLRAAPLSGTPVHLAELCARWSKRQGHTSDQALRRLNRHAKQLKRTAGDKSLSGRAYYPRSGMLLFPLPYTLQAPLHTLARSSAWSRRVVPGVTPRFMFLPKRPPADHTVGFYSTRRSDWCKPGAPAMLRSGVIRQ